MYCITVLLYYNFCVLKSCVIYTRAKKIISNKSHDFRIHDMFSVWVKLKPMWMYCITVLLVFSFS